jgi:hypothetical protein
MLTKDQKLAEDPGSTLAGQSTTLTIHHLEIKLSKINFEYSEQAARAQ